MGFSYDIALSFATEDQALVEKVYHYLKAENFSVFFAPSPEGQLALSGRNQREAFYDVFARSSEYVALFVSKSYVGKPVPMEEADLAFKSHPEDGKVIPIYLDGTPLPVEMLRPDVTNYFSADHPVTIAKHLAGRIRGERAPAEKAPSPVSPGNSMNIQGNTGGFQVFVQHMEIGKENGEKR